MAKKQYLKRVENFLNDERHKKVPSILSKINAKKTTHKYLIVKLLKTKDK